MNNCLHGTDRFVMVPQDVGSMQIHLKALQLSEKKVWASCPSGKRHCEDLDPGCASTCGRGWRDRISLATSSELRRQERRGLVCLCVCCVCGVGCACVSVCMCMCMCLCRCRCRCMCKLCQYEPVCSMLCVVCCVLYGSRCTCMFYVYVAAGG